MPKILDPRIKEGRRNRNDKVRKMFAEMAADHRTTEFIFSEIIREFGLSEQTIIKIIKGHGPYAE